MTETTQERAKKAVDAWDKHQDGDENYVPGVLVCIELIRDMLNKQNQDQDRNIRLVNTIYKLAHWNGIDIQDMIDEEMLEEGDLD